MNVRRDSRSCRVSHYRAKTLRGTETVPTGKTTIAAKRNVTIGQKPFGVLKLAMSNQFVPFLAWSVTIGQKPFGVLKLSANQLDILFGAHPKVTIGQKPFGVLKLFSQSNGG